ncbi:phenylalanyl-tRNA synthetase beta subunit [Natranaerovirga hydrolytica]|uniref:Phenylalanine--tRNA ligase beta subunit n=1 Tax=Natranaerovirga hydrolytica TaxID=680378 RepID=A0A4V2Q091_9FIRM|nr:phenylalanine--tRNA ligase subunit beta [Natranaerovirga hydrolytica]TCK92851.1 phenylalanyl-tRNA synthetase beta subunit [Natranaerovirga hydrolytica]
MLTPISWLKEYVEIDCDIKTFVDEMTMSGSNVETYEELGNDIDKVVVGKILSIKGHPDADKLVVTKVDVGDTEPIQIVTGADNISEGDYIPVAVVGAVLPGDFKIKKTKLRGIESNGMMCSVEELGLENEDFPEAPENGIYIFDKEYPLGEDVKKYFGLDETVVEFEITSNRPDCFSILGMAREVAATFRKPFNYPQIAYSQLKEKANDYAKISVKDKDLCPRYAAKIVKNVKIASSPKWMRQRLLACGVRPINNIVDITNYVMLEMGQPMHAFDLDKLENNEIIVRRGNKDEAIQTLDGEIRKVDESILVIADSKKAVAIAGIMGGEATKVTEETQTILFESANFDSTNIRLSSKKIGLRTDSSSKFEKNLDPNTVEEAINRACQLIVELGVGDVVEGMLDQYEDKRIENQLTFDPQAINQLLGTNISEDDMINYLESVELTIDKNTKQVTVPTFRSDIERSADLAEEVARLYGYNNIPTTLPSGTTVGKKNFKQEIEDLSRIIVEQCGFNESMNYSFESPKVFNKLKIEKDSPLRNAVTLSNPLGEDFSIMRTVTLNGLLNSLSTNYNRRNKNVKLYELANVYIPKELPLKDLPDERMKLTLGMYDSGDFFDLKGVIEALFTKLGLNQTIDYNPNKEIPWLHPGRKAEINYNKQSLGFIGEVHPDVMDAYDIEERVYVAVVDMPTLTELASLDREYVSIAKYPAMLRDLSITLKEDILVGQIESIIKQYGGKTLEAIELFDVYQGEQIEAGYKSVAYSISFRANDRTLKEKEVNKAMNNILKALEKELDAKLRA